MLFNSVEFLIFLPAVFAAYWILPHKFRWILLLLASYYFYMSWNVKYVLLILFTTLVSYTLAILIEKTADSKTRKIWVALAAVLCLGVLFIFKYLDFAFESVRAICSLFSLKLQPLTMKLLLPVGISFYTFQTLAYVIDVYRGRIPAEKHFGMYATFVSFFPQLVAGPIERTENLLPQIRAKHDFDPELASYGLRLMIWGFFKKMVIADNLAARADVIYGDIYAFSGFALVLASLFFAVEIYCDFSGYTDIARGVANLFGIRLMENFKSPFLTTSIREYWSKWHISLSTWLKDYLYIPLGGNRCSKARHCFNIFVTFLISGLWHGASWNFVIWGGLHGAVQVGEELLGFRKMKESRGIVRFLRICLVFAFLTAAWVFFRCSNLSEVAHFYSHAAAGITDLKNYVIDGLIANGFTGRGDFLLHLLFWMGPLTAYDIAAQKTDVIERIGTFRPVLRYGLSLLFILLICFCHALDAVSFVYFQF